MTGTLPDGRRVDRLTLRGGGLTAQVLTLFALSNLWMARRRLLLPTG